MSIGINAFEAQGSFATFDPYFEESERVAIFTLQCASCGDEPEDAVSPPRRCVKCGSTAFERFIRPGSILQNSERF